MKNLPFVLVKYSWIFHVFLHHFTKVFMNLSTQNVPPRGHSGHAASSGSGAVRRLCASTKGVGSLEGSHAAGVSGASGTWKDWNINNRMMFYLVSTYCLLMFYCFFIDVSIDFLLMFHLALEYENSMMCNDSLLTPRKLR